MSVVDAMNQEIGRLHRRVEQLEAQIERERRARRRDGSQVEPLVIPPGEPCIDPDGHRMLEFHSPMHLHPVAAICGTCGRHGRVKRDTTPRDAP